MTEQVIAKYIRLSMDDGITESLSIPHQRMLLDGFIEEMDMPNATVLEFVEIITSSLIQFNHSSKITAENRAMVKKYGNG